MISVGPSREYCSYTCGLTKVTTTDMTHLLFICLMRNRVGLTNKSCLFSIFVTKWMKSMLIHTRHYRTYEEDRQQILSIIFINNNNNPLDRACFFLYSIMWSRLPCIYSPSKSHPQRQRLPFLPHRSPSVVKKDPIYFLCLNNMQMNAKTRQQNPSDMR